MRIAILQANLGNFDTPKDPVLQDYPDEIVFHRFTDEDFPPIVGLTPRLQYRIPKLFGWQMFPDFDYYIWLDGSVSFQRDDCVAWYMHQLGDNDIGFFAHPNRSTIKAEVHHIEEHLQLGKKYITSRYAGGLHKEQLELIEKNKIFKDTKLYASTSFIYRNKKQVQDLMERWWYYQSRYFTCDQVVLPYLLWMSDIKVSTFNEPLYKSGYLSLVSHHA